jgi:hypothetical protein
MKRTLFSLLASAAIMATLPTAAADTDDPWYQVDIIVFEHAGAAAEAGLWQGELELAALPTNAIPLRAAPEAVIEDDETLAADSADGLKPEGAEAAFVRLEDDRQQLAPVLNRLLVTPRYVPLFHASWLQPASSAADFAGVRLAGVDEIPETAELSDPSDLLNEPLLKASTQGPFPSSEQPAIDGIVRLSRSRFLHLALDLRYRRSDTRSEGRLFSIFDRETEQESLYRLTQSRRVRSGELHYFDHPRFGAIVLLTPYTPAATTPQ